MTSITGKRKRILSSKDLNPTKSHTIEESSSSEEQDEEQLKAIFQRAFEAKFRPLPVEKKAVSLQPDQEEEGEKEDEGDGWEGLSEQEEEEMVQVIEYGAGQATLTTTRKEASAFLSSKVPVSGSAPAPLNPASAKEDDEEGERLNLKNDLALQRLLSESHLLDSSSVHSSLAPTGKSRLKALDLRMASLGARTSTDKMPMHMRKGMQAKRTSVEEKRRREAKENGIVLEKERRVRKFGGTRERGVGGPSVGKYRAGTLVLSKRDVRSIEMSGERERRGKKKGRR